MPPPRRLARSRKRSLDRSHLAPRRKPPHTPHDRLFRFVFSKPRHARGLLRRMLPAAITRQLHWATLRLEPGTYVDPRLARSATDVLLSIRIRGTKQRALVYLLLEHQSEADPMMPFRFLKYACRAWDDYVERPDAIGNHLPPLIPLLVHQGPHPWRGPRALSELHPLDGAPSALPPPIELSMLVHELQDDTLSSRELTTLARTALHLMKLVAAGTLDVSDAALLARWFAAVRVKYGHDALEALVEYLFQTDRSGTMIDAIAQESTEEIRDTITSIGDRLEARGVERGKIEGKAELVLDLLTARFGKLPVRVVRRVRRGEPSELQRWGTRLLTAATLADVFAEP